MIWLANTQRPRSISFKAGSNRSRSTCSKLGSRPLTFFKSKGNVEEETLDSTLDLEIIAKGDCFLSINLLELAFDPSEIAMKLTAAKIGEFWHDRTCPQRRE